MSSINSVSTLNIPNNKGITLVKDGSTRPSSTLEPSNPKNERNRGSWVSRKDNDEPYKKKSSVYVNFLRNSFDPRFITRLNIGNLEESRFHIFRTGCLPQWICRFPNLTSLEASKLGIIIIEPWLLQLKFLQEIHLEHNLISTWPYFLRELTELTTIRMDGNPCLEKAFNKSPTLRTWYFSWSAGDKVYKNIPEYIRGSEWPPASVARLGNSTNMKHLGFYCGGIYNLSVEAELSNDELLTPLEPDPLMTRLHSSYPQSIISQKSPISPIQQYTNDVASNSLGPVGTNSSGSQNDTNSYSGSSERKQGAKQMIIILEIFEDIHFLLMRKQLPKPSSDRPHALLVGNSSDPLNQLLVSKANGSQKFKLVEMHYFACKLLKEEEEYISELQQVINEFYEAKTSSSSVSDCLRAVFNGFPAMLAIHTKVILPSLKIFTQATFAIIKVGSTISAPSSNEQMRVIKKKIADITLQAIATLCTAFRRLQLAFDSYVRNLWRAEYLLDTSTAATTLYQDKKFGEYVKSQMAKLGGLSGHLGTPPFTSFPPGFFSLDFTPLGSIANIYSIDHLTNTLSSKDSGNSSLISQQVSKKLRWNKNHSLSKWLETQLHKRYPSISRHPMEFIHLPLARMIRYERFFTSFSRSFNRYDPVVKLLRGMRRSAAVEIQASRRKVRCQVLAVKFKTTPEYFDRYQWDAVLTIRSRSYFEPGILSKNTNDTIDYNGCPVSFVKEVFSENRLRILRMVNCGTNILLWDEVFEHFIGKIDKSEFIAIPSNDPQHPTEVRIVFLSLLETCLVEVRDFKAKYSTSHDLGKEFIQASQNDCKVML